MSGRAAKKEEMYYARA